MGVVVGNLALGTLASLANGNQSPKKDSLVFSSRIPKNTRRGGGSVSGTRSVTQEDPQKMEGVHWSV